jgi:hypothetical protein
MALTESRVISQITTLPQANAINVQWSNIIFRDDVEISKTYERRSYGVDQKAEFLAEVEGAEKYITAMGW